jgi:hypothetical protein
MAEYEISHPMGQDIERVHGALLAGLGGFLSGDVDHPGYRSSMRATFKNALETGTGYSQLKIADIALGRLVWIESAVIVPKGHPDWTVQWGETAVAVRHRIQVRDALFEKLETPLSNTLTVADKLVFDITDGGVVLKMADEKVRDELIGCYDDADYDRINANLRKETGLDELVTLADAA